MAGFLLLVCLTMGGTFVVLLMTASTQGVKDNLPSFLMACSNRRLPLAVVESKAVESKTMVLTFGQGDVMMSRLR